MENRWIDRISDYVDGTMDAAEAALFEARMAEDPQLAADVESVRELVSQAGTLEGIDPPPGLWDAIAAELPPRAESAPILDLPRERARRGLSFNGWQAIAAAVTLAILSGAMGWILRGGSESPDASSGPPVVAERTVDGARPGFTSGRADDLDTVSARFDEENAHLAENIRELEVALVDHADELDEETRAIVEDNLMLIDSAIRDALRALGKDPDSDYLRNHLASTMQRKARLLESATRLTRREI